MTRRLLSLGAAAGMIAGLAAAVQAAEPPRAPHDPVVAALETMLRDEHRAADAYQRVLRDFGDVRPFFSLVHHEDLHAELVAALFRGRGLRVPPRPETANGAAPYRTLAQACRAALDAERANLARYDGYLAGDLPRDVRHVFEHNRRASARAHVPAFARCAGGAE